MQQQLYVFIYSIQQQTGIVSPPCHLVCGTNYFNCLICRSGAYNVYAFQSKAQAQRCKCCVLVLIFLFATSCHHFIKEMQYYCSIWLKDSPITTFQNVTTPSEKNLRGEKSSELKLNGKHLGKNWRLHIFGLFQKVH